MKAQRQRQTGRRARSAPTIEVQVDDPAWRRLGTDLLAQIRCAARLALARADSAKRGGGLTILLTGDDRVQSLNRDYRRKDKPTNVLSFPARTADYLGDIAIACGVAVREAEAARLTPLNHVQHLVVHGVLHLLGYDHEAPKDAEIMESLEAEILAEMKIPNPYLRCGCAA